jgi:hypothetical protein
MNNNWFQIAIQKAQELLSPKLFSPIPASAAEATLSPTVTPQQQPVQQLQEPPKKQFSQDQYKQAIQAGFQNWGNPPAATLAGEFAKAPGSDPIYQQYPFLLPAISVLETSGGAKEKQPNNLLNWGINLPKGYFDPQNPQETINKAMTGLAGRTPDYTPQKYLDTFRKTGDLSALGNWYAPPSDNPGTGGNTYADNLRQVMSIFQKKLR